MANKEFLKKVYDQYLNTDYEYGTSNLNPKREISPEDLESTKDLEQMIEDQIRRKVAEIELSFSTPKKDFDIRGNTPNEVGKLMGNGSADGNGGKFPKTGGSILDDDIDDSPLLDLIDELILKLSVILDQGPSDWKDTEQGKTELDPLDIFDVPPSCPDCFSHDNNKNKGKVTNASAASNKNGNDGSDDDANDGDGNGDGDDGKACPICGQPLKNGKCPSCEAELCIQCKVNKHLPNGKLCQQCLDKNKKDKENSPAAWLPPWMLGLPYSCVIEDLAILKIILMICKIIGILKKAIILVCSIGIPIIKIAARCAACWNNPVFVAEAAQLILEKIGSLLIGIICELLQKIWDMLGFDCGLQAAQSIIDQIITAMTAIGNLEFIGSKEEWTAISDAYKNEIDDLVEAAKESKKNSEGWAKQLEKGALDAWDNISKDLNISTDENGKPNGFDWKGGSGQVGSLMSGTIGKFSGIMSGVEKIGGAASAIKKHFTPASGVEESDQG